MLVKDKSEYVFETYFGEPFNTCDKISSHYWRPTLKNLGITYRNLYQMRHTFASLMISNGEDILWVSNMLGHKHSSMTLDMYARYIRQKNRKRATFLQEAS
jgi:integrase